MNYSLINAVTRLENRVCGYWLQDCSGTTLEEAKKRAKQTEEANGNNITVVVTEPVRTTTPMLHFFQDLIVLE